MTEENIFEANDSLVKRMLMTYGEDNMLTGISEFNHSNELIKKIKYVYDVYKNIEEELWYDAADELLDSYRYRMQFDKTKNWIKKITFRNGVAVTIAEREISYYK